MCSISIPCDGLVGIHALVSYVNTYFTSVCYFAFWGMEQRGSGLETHRMGLRVLVSFLICFHAHKQPSEVRANICWQHSIFQTGHLIFGHRFLFSRMIPSVYFRYAVYAAHFNWNWTGRKKSGGRTSYFLWTDLIRHDQTSRAIWLNATVETNGK